jgi:hypothetical protein
MQGLLAFVEKRRMIFVRLKRIADFGEIGGCTRIHEQKTGR